MNEKHGWTALIAAGLAFSFIATVACSVRLANRTWLWLWLPLALVLVALLIWVWFRRDKVPDQLAQAGWEYFERDGFCFVCAPAVVDGRCQMNVLYQNRYDTPCIADVLLRPDDGSAEFGLTRLLLHVQCEGAGAGKVSVPWEVPSGLKGQTITYEIGANVRYPDGQGRLVRFRDGIQVGTTKDLKELFRLGQPARIELTIPNNFVEMPSSPASTPVTPKHFVEAPPAQKSQPDGWKQFMAGTPADRPVPNQNETTSTIAAQAKPSPADTDPLSERQVEAVVAELSGDANPHRHANAVRQWKRGQWALATFKGALSVLGGCALLALGIWAFMNGGRMPLKIWCLILLIAGFGALFIVLGFMTGAMGLSELWSSFSTEPAANPLSACRNYYTAAVGEFHIYGNAFAPVCQNFPASILEKHRRGSREAAHLVSLWGQLKKRHAAKDASVTVIEVTVEQTPRANPAIIDLLVTVRGRPFGEMVFRNVAVCTQGQCFLATPEPMLVEHRPAPIFDPIKRRRLV